MNILKSLKFHLAARRFNRLRQQRFALYGIPHRARGFTLN